MLCSLCIRFFPTALVEAPKVRVTYSKYSYICEDYKGL